MTPQVNSVPNRLPDKEAVMAYDSGREGGTINAHARQDAMSLSPADYDIVLIASISLGRHEIIFGVSDDHVQLCNYQGLVI